MCGEGIGERAHHGRVCRFVGERRVVGLQQRVRLVDSDVDLDNVPSGRHVTGGDIILTEPVLDSLDAFLLWRHEGLDLRAHCWLGRLWLKDAERPTSDLDK